MWSFAGWQALTRREATSTSCGGAWVDSKPNPLRASGSGADRRHVHRQVKKARPLDRTGLPKTMLERNGAAWCQASWLTTESTCAPRSAWWERTTSRSVRGRLRPARGADLGTSRSGCPRGRRFPSAGPRLLQSGFRSPDTGRCRRASGCSRRPRGARTLALGSGCCSVGWPGSSGCRRAWRPCAWPDRGPRRGGSSEVSASWPIATAAVEYRAAIVVRAWRTSAAVSSHSLAGTGPGQDECQDVLLDGLGGPAVQASGQPVLGRTPQRTVRPGLYVGIEVVMKSTQPVLGCRYRCCEASSVWMPMMRAT
jgi:hypothetical protein